MVLRVTVACGILATAAVSLRFVARRKSKASFAADDWWMVASLSPSYGMLIVGSISPFVDSSYSSYADEFSGYKRKRWPACQHLDRKSDGNILEGRMMNCNTLLSLCY